jgi:hypothetical protein
VAGERRLDRDLRRLQVADLADEDDVGVLTQEVSQKPGEGQPLLDVDLALDQAVDVVLDGVLGGQDLGGRLVWSAR